ncbi:hypothetical protein [Candidatus Karelsulcia muelleri]|nr:hypothetical protein [Candidatus Karelsulcia muelleri]
MLSLKQLNWQLLLKTNEIVTPGLLLSNNKLLFDKITDFEIKKQLNKLM